MIRLARWTCLASVAAICLLSIADRAAAQAVDLAGLGINANFELPALAHVNTTEATSTADMGPGWTYTRLSGSTSDNFGVADPIGEGATPFYCCFSGPAPDGVLPAPFEGRQIGFINLTDTDSMAQIVSLPVGTLQAGQTYSLTVALGGRATDAWADYNAAIGLATSTTKMDLGSFATTTVNPAAANQTNIADLTYTLNVNAQAASFVGQDVSIVIRANNGFSGGASPPDFVQANFDNVRLTGTFGPATNNAPALTINRDTGGVTLSKTGSTNYNIIGYELSSDASGSLNQANWTKISVAYDQSGNKSVDSDDNWTVLSAAGDSTDLSEAELEAGGNGGTLSTASPINLGTPWRRTPYQDVAAKIVLAGGAELTVPVTYSGAAIVSGDLNADGAINTADWSIFKSGQGANFAGLSKAQTYAMGDLNGDSKHDLTDFSAFRTAFDAANGIGSFAAMVAAVPEPTSILLGLGAVCGTTFCGRRRRRLGMRVGRVVPAALFAMVVALMSTRASAQSVIAHWSFDTPKITTDATGILTAADETGLHNATTMRTGDPQINSVAGAFGQAAQFTNTNANGVATAANNAWLSFPQLTEIAGPTGGDFTVSAWAKVPPQDSWDPDTILADWGNTTTTPGRFTYWFSLINPNSASEIGNIRPRIQLRSDNGSANGLDIIANTISAANAGQDSFDDDVWHQYIWKWEKAPGIASFYIDGVLKTTATANAANPNHDVIVSASPIGALGAKRDNNRYFVGTMDEVWVINGAISDQQAQNLFTSNTLVGNALTLRIDQTNGQIEIRNDKTEAIDLSSYELTSESSGLDLAGWRRISSQNLTGFPVGNGSGNGWEAGPNSNNKALVEWYLQGLSTLNPGASVKLGSAYNETLDANDLVFKYTTSNGSVVPGIVEFGTVTPPPPLSNVADFNNDTLVNVADLAILRSNFGSATSTKATGDANGDGHTDGADFLVWQRNLGATSSVATAAAIPEPGAGVLLLVGGIAFVAGRSRTRRQSAPARCVAASATLLIAAATANATVTIDRNYRFGDEASEGATIGAAVGANNAFGTTFDSAGTPGTGTLQDLEPANGPLYADVGPSGLARPGAASGQKGISFDGLDDYLRGLRLGFPGTSASSTFLAGPTGLNYKGISNHGFQLWVRPATASVAQNVVLDTDQLGVRINAAGNWELRYNNANVASTKPVAANAWTHIMAVRPFGSTAPGGGAVLYVNGEAVAAAAGNYNTNDDNQLIVGANTGTNFGTADYFSGTLDDLSMFVSGKTVDGVDRGTFNLGADNGFLNRPLAQGGLTGKAGDVNQDNALTTADVTAFVAGWGSAKLVNNVRVGDKTTLGAGDLNFDGVTNIADAAILNSALHAASLPALDLSTLAVPEPSTLALAATLACLAARRRSSIHLV